MTGRELHYMSTGTSGVRADVPLPPSTAQLKAAELIHRLRGERPRLRLVRGETDRIEVMPVDEHAAVSGTGAARTSGGQTQPLEASSHTPRQAATLAPPHSPAITSAADPRWVLAIRAAESLQGAILGPERRDRLVKLGKLMGLTAFDANLVIAIVQDQARRGHAPALCPAAGEAQLAMVPLPRTMDAKVDARTRRIGIITGVITMLVGIELIVLKWLFA